VPAPEHPYRLVVSRTAAQQIAEQLPEAVAAAVFNFVKGDLRNAPRRVGKPLGGDLAPRFTARRGEYRVVYLIDDKKRTVTVVDIRHRRDAYRRR
jgi:mRNA-degrading endonuclease RelE of RelBE toxin-antitoxin system